MGAPRRSLRGPLLLGLLHCVARAANAQGDGSNFTNVLVSPEGEVTTVESEETHELPVGTLSSVHAAAPSGFDGHITIAGPSSITFPAEKGVLGTYALEMRQSAQLFVQWLNTERGGLRVAGRRMAMRLVFVDDGALQDQVTNATARALRSHGAHFALAGYSSGLTQHSAVQARADGKVMIAAAASWPEIYASGGDKLFGFLTTNFAIPFLEFVVRTAEGLDASSSANAYAAAPCGTAGCRAQLRFATVGNGCYAESVGNRSESLFGMPYEHAAVFDDTSDDELRRALRRLRANKVTVVEFCRLSLQTIRRVTELMAELRLELYALRVTGLINSTTYADQLRNGWWEGAHILEPTSWYTSSQTRGEFSGMTSQEFADRFHAHWGNPATYRAAAQFCALSALSAAIEATDSLDATIVADRLRSLSLTEFYTPNGLSFDEHGQIELDTNVLQAPKAGIGISTPAVVHMPGAESMTAPLVFPKPPWAQQRCRYTTRAPGGAECSSHGSCSLDGRCACNEGWQGAACNLRLAEPWSIPQSVRIVLIVAGVALVLSAVPCCVCRCRRWLKQRRAKHMRALEDAIVSGAVDKLELARSGTIALNSRNVMRRESLIRRKLSEEAGVGLAYLLSKEFLDLARVRSGQDDPTFYDLQEPFFFGDSPIGAEETCPRDGAKGCAFVDTLPQQHRRRCTHFLSWTWGYRVSVVRDALQNWLENSGLHAEDVFVYMCFFVNNQYRILVSGEKTGSEDLERVFETNMARIGNVISLLDTWDGPRYLTRIWTIFEQITAMKLGITVTIILPRAASQTLMHELEQGKKGLLRVKEALTKVKSESAEATCKEDEEAVKDLIKRTFDGGFCYVDEQIKLFMIRWMGTVMEAHMMKLIHQSSTDSDAAPSRQCNL